MTKKAIKLSLLWKKRAMLRRKKSDYVVTKLRFSD